MKAEEKTKAQIDREMKMVGGSFLELKRTMGVDGKTQWQLNKNSNKAFRIDANSEIPMVGPAGGKVARGTMGNCSGGVTPWGTILSGEENVEGYFHPTPEWDLGWGRFYQEPIENYGWVVEVDVEAKAARKLTSLGRFAHESATVTLSKDNRVVVYSGDDSMAQCLYKFVSKNKFTGDKSKDKDLLLEGELYVADFRASEWVALNLENKKLLASGKFKTQADICLNTREAAKIAGGTLLNRPEDIEVDTKNGIVYLALTNNSRAGDFYGSITMLREGDGDTGSLTFSFDTHLSGSPSLGMLCPDNLLFDKAGQLWVCTDISASALGKGAYKHFERNSMFRLEMETKTRSVHARHFLQGPHSAELTGPSFSPDMKSLFVSVQHPGEDSFSDGNTMTSHWPRGGKSVPLSTLIVVEEDGSSFV